MPDLAVCRRFSPDPVECCTTAPQAVTAGRQARAKNFYKSKSRYTVYVFPSTRHFSSWVSYFEHFAGPDFAEAEAVGSRNKKRLQRECQSDGFSGAPFADLRRIALPEFCTNGVCSFGCPTEKGGTSNMSMEPIFAKCALTAGYVGRCNAFRPAWRAIVR